MNELLSNGPVRQILELTHQEIGRLTLMQAHVESVKLNGYKATIVVAPGHSLPVDYQEDGYAVLQKGAVKIVWRIPAVD